MTIENKYSALIEEIRDQNMIVLEALTQMQEALMTITTKEGLKKVADKVKIIKLMLTDTED